MKRLLLLVLPLIAAAPARAEPKPAAAGPKLPFVDAKYSSFAGECRAPKRWILGEDAIAYTKYRGGKTIASLPKGTVVSPKRSLDVVVKTVPVKARRSFGPFKAGDTAYLLSMGPDASYRLWFRGKIVVDEHDETQNLRFEDVTAPVDGVEMWVEIGFHEGKRRKTGWILTKRDACAIADEGAPAGSAPSGG